MRAAFQRPALELAAFVSAHLDTRIGGQPDERIAAKTLPADDGFEQVGMRRLGKLEVNRQRGFEVGKRFQHQRNAVITLRRKLVEL